MQTAYTDRLLGDHRRSSCAQTGLYDRSLLLVTADHGLAFTPGEDEPFHRHRGHRPGRAVGAAVHQAPGAAATRRSTTSTWSMSTWRPPSAELAWADRSRGRPTASRGPTRRQADAPAHREMVLPAARGSRPSSRGPANQRHRPPGRLRPGSSAPRDDYLDWFKLGPSPTWSAGGSATSPSAPAAGRPGSSGSTTTAASTPASGQVPAQVGGQLTRVATGPSGTAGRRGRAQRRDHRHRARPSPRATTRASGSAPWRPTPSCAGVRTGSSCSWWTPPAARDACAP